MKRLTIIFILLHTLVNAQVIIKEIKKQPNTKFFNTKDSTITYPIVVTGSKAVDEKINFKIRDALLFPDSAIASKPVEVILDSTISSSLVSMSYEITFNRSNILSFTVYAEGCAAYCSEWQVYFNFNTQTGNMIGVDDIFKSDGKEVFKNLVSAAKVAELMRYKEELKEKLGKGVDQETYDAATEIVDSYCINSISLNKFSLSDSNIEIFDRCDFPHVINNMGPVYHLNYTYKAIRELLKTEWKKILMK